MKFTDILSTLIFIPIGFYVVECCKDLNTGKCCFNFYQNENGICEECPFGMFGENCGSRCLSGYFGRLCQEKCSCETKDCDNVNGCSPQTDWSPLAMKINSNSTTKAKPIRSTTWRNIAFLLIGSIGTCVIVGMVYYVKSGFFKKRLHAFFTGRINNTESSVSFPGENPSDRNSPAVQNDVNEIQQFQTDYENSEVVHDHGIFERRDNGSPFTTNGVVFETEMVLCGESHEDTKNETLDLLSSSTKSSERKMGNQISERISDSNFRPYSTVKYNRNMYELKTEDDQHSAPYQSLLFCKTEEETCFLHEDESYQDTIPNCRDEENLNTQKTIQVSECDRNPSPAILDSGEETLTDNLEFRNCNVYCNEYREPADEWPFDKYLTQNDRDIEKEVCEASVCLVNLSDKRNPDKETVTGIYHSGTSLLHHSADKGRISSVLNLNQTDAREEYLSNHRPHNILIIGTNTDDNDRSSNENSGSHYEELDDYEYIYHSD